jgi:DUF1365 family protein
VNAIYQGRVAHARPGKHRLRYRIFMLALDLDKLSAIDARLRLFSHNRANLLSLCDRDHADRIAAPIKPQIETKLRESGIEWNGGRIMLLTMPRLFNYVFNPLSVYFCWRRDGSLAALAHEVSNTFGERHFYVLPPHDDGGGVAQSCDKAFFVSPFLEMGLRYEFRVTPPGETTRVAMTVKRGEEIALTASFAGDRRDLTDANLFRAWLSHPLMTFKVLAGIHWEALKMWLKGVKFIGRTSSSVIPGLAPLARNDGGIGKPKRSAAPPSTPAPASPSPIGASRH